MSDSKRSKPAKNESELATTEKTPGVYEEVVYSQELLDSEKAMAEAEAAMAKLDVT